MCVVSLAVSMKATYNTLHESGLLNKAVDVALEVRQRAYAPYSQFLVGAVLIDDQHHFHLGCNVENASYGLTQCAERSAVTAATAAGRRSMLACVIVTDTEEPTMPCGACRQVLAEYGTDLLVVSRTLSGAERIAMLSELLPHSFGPTSLPARG
jgi:cytidine deaminase